MRTGEQCTQEEISMQTICNTREERRRNMRAWIPARMLMKMVGDCFAVVKWPAIVCMAALRLWEGWRGAPAHRCCMLYLPHADADEGPFPPWQETCARGTCAGPSPVSCLWSLRLLTRAECFDLSPAGAHGDAACVLDARRHRRTQRSRAGKARSRKRRCHYSR